jgi:hypothetical protein
MSNWGFQLGFDVDSPTRNLDRFDAELTHVGLDQDIAATSHPA